MVPETNTRGRSRIFERGLNVRRGASEVISEAGGLGVQLPRNYRIFY